MPETPLIALPTTGSGGSDVLCSAAPAFLTARHLRSARGASRRERA
jgi:hypothetical protein